MARKEYDLTQAVLRYAAACAREGDWTALRDIGFGQRAAETLDALTLGELQRLECKMHGHILQVRLDREAFWHVIQQIERETRWTRVKRELLRRDAPAEMMESLFGMGHKKYTACRKLVGAPRAVGRPAEPDEATAHRMWLAWNARAGNPLPHARRTGSGSPKRRGCR
jgi:hypothetical protein